MIPEQLCKHIVEIFEEEEKMIDCKAYADEILSTVNGYGHLAVVSIGDDPASQSYIRGKKKDCERVGFKFTHCAFANGDPEEEIGRVCVQLASPDFKYMSGETLTLEGGMGLRP